MATRQIAGSINELNAACADWPNYVERQVVE
jgi:hypothetical protein